MAKVENFSPYLLSLAKRAMVERIDIPCTDHATAKRLQARFNKLRVAMRNENHPALALIERVSARVSAPSSEKQFAIFEPADFELENLLKGAGIDLVEWE